MLCPKCGKEMEKGLLQSNGSTLIWDTKKHSICVRPSENGIGLAFDYISATVENVYCCRECKIISFDYSEKNIEFF